MTRFRTALIAIILSVATGVAFAHIGGHEDEPLPITEQQVVSLSGAVVDNLVAKKRLPSSWRKRQHKQTLSRDAAEGKVWVVIYSNPAEKDAQKNTLYVLFDELGNFLQANHTGNL